MGVYLGTSPRHARSVSLILSLSTGLCSPQFHVSHDDFFETTRKNPHLDSSSKWQALSGLTKDMTTPSSSVQDYTFRGSSASVHPPLRGRFSDSPPVSEGYPDDPPPPISHDEEYDQADTNDYSLLDSIGAQPNPATHVPTPPSSPGTPKF